MRWVAIALLALGVRLFHLAEWRATPLARHLLGDGVAYREWALGIAGGDWIGAEVFYQAPLYPYLLALIYAVAGDGHGTVRLLQAGLGAGGCVLLGLAGNRLLGPPVGTLAAAALALWPSAVFHDGLVQKSSLELFLVCALLAALAAAWPQGRRRWWLATGALLGLLALARENALVLAPVLAAAALLRGGARPALLLVLGLVLALAPAAVRNRVAGGEWHVTTAQFGPNLFIGNHPGATGMYRPLVYGRGDARHERADAVRLAERAEGRALTPGEVSSYWTGRAAAFAAAEPGRWLALTARKALLLVNRVEVGDAEDQYTYADSSRLLALTSPVLHFGLLVPLAAAGLLLGWRRPATRLLAALLAAYAATVVGTYVMARYRHPLLPLLLLLAASAAVEVVRPAREGKWAVVGAAAAVAALAAVAANWPLVAVAEVRSATLYNLGRVLQDDPRSLAEAARFYLRAIELEPAHALAYGNLAVVLEQQGRRDEALAAVARAIELRPSHGDFHYNRARLLDAGGAEDEAVAAYEQVLALDPINADAHVNLGAIHQRRGDLEAAERAYTAALAIDDRLTGALNNLGVLQASRGDLQAAIASFRAAAAAGGESSSARLNLVRALADAGRISAALAEAEAVYDDSAGAGDGAAARAIAEQAAPLAAGSGDLEAERRWRARLTARGEAPIGGAQDQQP